MAILFKRGLKIDEYTLIEKKGSGSTAEVWHIKNNEGSSKAMKVYSPNLELAEIDKLLLKEEYDFAKKLDNQNILPLEKYGEFKGVPYIIMPLAISSLQDELNYRMSKYKDIPYFSEKQLITILYEIANALIYLEDKKIVHRDLKPGNILILNENKEERLVLMDFNISKSLKQKILSQTRSLSNSTSGLTPAYAAPEIILGKEGNSQSDVFSLGITLYELATGNIPSNDTLNSPAQILVNGGELPIKSIRDFSNEFNSIILLCINFHKYNRPTPLLLKKWSEYFINNEEWPTDLYHYINKVLKVDADDPSDDYNHNDNDKNNPNIEQYSSNYKITKRRINLINSIYLKIGIGVLLFFISSLSFIHLMNIKEFNDMTKTADLYFMNGQMKSAKKYYEKAYKIKKDKKINTKINLTNNLINKYKTIKRFEARNNIARVQDFSQLWGLINQNGEEILPPSMKKIAIFKNNKAEYEDDNGNIGYINKYGEILK